VSTVIEDQRDSLLQKIWEEHRGWVLTCAALVISLAVWKVHGTETVFPKSWIEAFPFAEKVNEFDKWIRPFIQPTT